MEKYSDSIDFPQVLIACEQSQVVCTNFREAGYEAYSCDILPCYGGHPEWHIVGDATQVIGGHGEYTLENGSKISVPGFWALIIAHPPCTMLTHSSAVALSKGLHSEEDIKKARNFFMTMLNAPAPLVAVENPAPMKFIGLPRYNQIVQPYNFGHPYSKRVCLWLKNLPPLLPMRATYTTHKQWLEHCASNPRRRSKTFEGIAEAMAAQWGSLL